MVWVALLLQADARVSATSRTTSHTCPPRRSLERGRDPRASFSGKSPERRVGETTGGHAVKARENCCTLGAAQSV